MMSFEAKEKKVRLCIENLIDGHLTIVERNLTDLGVKVKGKILVMANTTQESDGYRNQVAVLYTDILSLRLDSALDGLIIDKDYEALKSENERLRKENISLARELKDRQHIIEEYENMAYNKDSNNDK